MRDIHDTFFDLAFAFDVDFSRVNTAKHWLLTERRSSFDSGPPPKAHRPAPPKPPGRHGSQYTDRVPLAPPASVGEVKSDT